MFTVALIGSDGAGKSTIARNLESILPLRAKYVYMGVNLNSSNLVLPTTRLWLEIKRLRGDRPDMAGPPDPTQIKAPPKGVIRGIAEKVKSSLRLVNRLGEEWFRQMVVWYYHRQGYIILFDRHFYSDFYASDIADVDQYRPLDRRIHGFILSRFYPKPDLFICLDAPAQVLFERKNEGTLRSLERRRQEYLQLKDIVQNFAIVDATQPLDLVTRKVADLILNFRETRNNREI